MKTRYLLWLSVMLVFFGAIVCPQGQDDAKTPSQRTLYGPAIGSQAPDFDLMVLGGKGKTMQLSSLKGKAVVIDFWATYCEPCKIEMPWLVQLQKKYGPQGLQIVGVAVDDAEEKDVSDFARKMGVNYPVLIGTEKVANLYGGLEGLPTNFFLDRSGKVVDHVLGLVSESVFEDNIKKSLEQGNTSSPSPQ
jgi:thiol-disulfide isomerase/thioredoxin